MWITLKKKYTKYELLQTCFSRILATDEETNTVQNTCLTEQPLHKITIGCFYATFLFSKFVCIWLLMLHATMQSLKRSWVVAMESFTIELIEAIVHKCSKKGVFKILEEITRKHPYRNTTSDNRV